MHVFELGNGERALGGLTKQPFACLNTLEGVLGYAHPCTHAVEFLRSIGLIVRLAAGARIEEAPNEPA